MVALSVMILRRTDPTRHRPFRTPAVWIVAPLAVVGCVGLYASLPSDAMLVLPVWGCLGLLIYFLYGYRQSHVESGLTEVQEDDQNGRALRRERVCQSVQTSGVAVQLKHKHNHVVHATELHYTNRKALQRKKKK